jgi:hypothetical protein
MTVAAEPLSDGWASGLEAREDEATLVEVETGSARVPNHVPD